MPLYRLATLKKVGRIFDPFPYVIQFGPLEASQMLLQGFYSPDLSRFVLTLQPISVHVHLVILLWLLSNLALREKPPRQIFDVEKLLIYLIQLSNEKIYWPIVHGTYERALELIVYRPL
ncbi:MAG: Uncharacterised protein [Acidimicrobiales bacterium AG-410-I20]|nr:MAG: Uncharacterised protein [Acidimicrobiales bacterium AG-410-I20]